MDLMVPSFIPARVGSRFVGPSLPPRSGGRPGGRERPVTTHLGNIYGKLGVGTRVAAIRAATISGLVSVGVQE